MMFESLLRTKNFYWIGDAYQPSLELGGATNRMSAIQNLQGQYSLTFRLPDNKILFIRDRLGINKLFFAVHQSGQVLVANYLLDLVKKGVPFEAIYSVPAGHILELDAQQQELSLTRYFDPKLKPQAADVTFAEVGRAIRKRLELWFSRLAKELRSRKVYLCLSGGLDSGLIAALAKQYFPDITAYTYGFTHAGQVQSEDADYAQKLADFLDIPFRFVPASSDEILSVLPDALCYGQDWRDFNVHCAVVNQIVAKAIVSDRQKFGHNTPGLVLTGDLMNEFMADYSPVSYRGREYYPLPKLDIDTLRVVLMRGLDAGDREIGIFNQYGLDIIQPYGFLIEQFLQLPKSLVCKQRAKQNLFGEIAGDLLPSFTLKRSKVRAQIGSSTQPTGILPLFADTGRNSQWLKNAFREIFSIKKDMFLNQFIRIGFYRYIHKFPPGGDISNGYLTS